MFAVPFLVLTATTTSKGTRHIKENLEMLSAGETTGDFDKPNLYLMASVKLRGSDKSVIKQAMQFDGERGQYSFVGPTIIYC